MATRISWGEPVNNQAHKPSKRLAAGLIALGFVIVMFAIPQETLALIIERDFLGGTPQPNAVGSGNLTDLFNAAADRWEQAIGDPFTVTLHYGWAPIGGGLHTLNAQGGTPNRESDGTIEINNDTIPGHFRWFLDPTPRLNEEYLSFREASTDLGGGTINIGRVFSDASGDAGGFVGLDLYSTLLHEIGHGLGLSLANVSFIAESTDGDIDVTAPRPFAGTTVPLNFNFSGVDSHPDLTNPLFGQNMVMTSTSFNERRDLSSLDILIMAQLSGFNTLDSGPANPIPEPSTWLLFGSGLAGLMLWRKRPSSP
jgi:hypothetical protein